MQLLAFLDYEAAGGGILGCLGGGLGLILLVALYIFYCYCLKLICQKSGVDPGVIIWIPIVQFLPLFQIAGINPLWILGLLVPILNLVITVWLWAKVCEVRGKSPWLVVMLFIPILNILFLPYLAFSD